MTVSYTSKVATCTGLGCFWKLLFRWRGSIYKLLWPNLSVYSVLYFTLSFTYRFVLVDEQRTVFEKLALYCQTYGDLIPAAFVLGFYVTLVIKRWWDQYLCIPWPDNIALFVSSLVQGQDDRGRMIRRTIMRYVNLSLLLTLRMISPRVKKRFPTMDHVVEAGWMLPGEKKIYDDLEHKTAHAKYWMPLVWAGGIVTRARKEERIKDDFALKTLIDELNNFRGGCGGLLNYDWISIPLVYTQVHTWLQVVTLAVYIYFLASLMGNQFLDPAKGYSKHQVDLYLPIFTFLQFFFYMGWLKVAESLVNPFGEDDDDFELNWLLDRNLQISYVIVDEMHQEHPEMLKDQYWDEVFPIQLPYTAASMQYHTGPPQYSAEEVEVPLHKSEFMPMDSVIEEREEPESDSQDVELEIEHSNMPRGETHPMKIRRRSRASSTSGSAQSTSFSASKGRSSVLNLLSRIFRHNEGNKDDVIQLGSSMSLRSRRANRSTSRVSSVSQSIAPSRCSFVRENTQDADYHEEVFSMSDIDLNNSNTPNTPQQITHKKKKLVDPSLSASQTSVLTSVYKGSLPNEDEYSSTPKVGSISPKKEVGFSSKTEVLTPTSQIFSNDLMSRGDPRTKVIVQAHSPIYHVFTPTQAPTNLQQAMKPIMKAMEEGEIIIGSVNENTPNLSPTILQKISIIPNPMQDQIFEDNFSPRINDMSLNFAINELPLSKTAEQTPFENYFSHQVGSPHQILQNPLYIHNESPHRSQSSKAFDKSHEFCGKLVDPVKSPSTQIKDLPFFSEEPFCEKSREKLQNEKRDDLVVIEEIVSVIPVPPPLIESVIVIPKLEDSEPGLDPNNPSAAIPVPGISQTHSNQSPDMEIVRRPMLHELEPIIEHRDEGTPSPCTSYRCQEYENEEENNDTS